VEVALLNEQRADFMQLLVEVALLNEQRADFMQVQVVGEVFAAERDPHARLLFVCCCHRTLHHNYYDEDVASLFRLSPFRPSRPAFPLPELNHATPDSRLARPPPSASLASSLRSAVNSEPSAVLIGPLPSFAWRAALDCLFATTANPLNCSTNVCWWSTSA